MSQMMLLGCGSSGAGAPAFAGPLDAYTANLVVAWSVGRRLLASYSGALIRVRRDSDDAEQDISPDSLGALDTTALGAFIGSDSAYVAKVYHQNGGVDLAQTTAASQPRIASAGTIDTMGGLPAMKFDGTDDHLQCDAINLDEMAWYVALKTGASTANFLALLSQPAGAIWTSPYSRLLLDTFLAAWRQWVEDDSYSVANTGSYIINTSKLMEVHNVNGTGNFSVDNGTAAAAGAAPATVTDSTQPFLVGQAHPGVIATSSWNGYIGEVLGWGAGYDASARATRRAVMNDFWNLY